MVSLLDSWQNPQYLTRIWYRALDIARCVSDFVHGALRCIFEVLTAARLEIDMQMILPPNEIAMLKEEIDKEGGVQRVRDNVAEINVQDAQATQASDAVKVRKRIDETLGLSQVNAEVKKCMVRLFGDVFTDMIGDSS